MAVVSAGDWIPAYIVEQERWRFSGKSEVLYVYFLDWHQYAMATASIFSFSSKRILGSMELCRSRIQRHNCFGCLFAQGDFNRNFLWNWVDSQQFGCRARARLHRRHRWQKESILGLNHCCDCAFNSKRRNHRTWPPFLHFFSAASDLIRTWMDNLRDLRVSIVVGASGVGFKGLLCLCTCHLPPWDLTWWSQWMKCISSILDMQQFRAARTTFVSRGYDCWAFWSRKDHCSRGTFAWMEIGGTNTGSEGPEDQTYISWRVSDARLMCHSWCCRTWCAEFRSPVIVTAE